MGVVSKLSRSLQRPVGVSRRLRSWWGFAALLLAMLPLAVLLSGARLDWLSPVLTSLAAILAETKVVAALWGMAHGGW